MARSDRPRLAVFKFASCDGCQLSLLDCEDELLSIAERLDIVHFPEASRRMLTGPYDIALVEGSITTAHDRERLTEIREWLPGLYRCLCHRGWPAGYAQLRRRQ